MKIIKQRCWFRVLSAGFRLLATGYRQLAAGYLQLATTMKGATRE